MYAYFKISEWRAEKGLHMFRGCVNFFLRGGFVMAMWRNLDHFVEVKSIHTQPRSLYGYCRGQILAMMNEEDGDIIITIAKGIEGHEMGFDRETGMMSNAESVEHYPFPMQFIEWVVQLFEEDMRTNWDWNRNMFIRPRIVSE